VTSSYVIRVLYLAFLAPDIALAVARGEHPVGLTAKQLLRSVPLSLDWDEQRKRVGFVK
jgi:site-specific DNA recombinase